MSAESLKPCRLIIDGEADGAWNMALDEALASAANGFVLRMYRWKPATLSLGYFQYCDERRSHEASHDCPMVRRASGGGAIVHDRELTYTLVAPIDDPVARHPRQLYHAVHASLVEALGLCGIATIQNEESLQTSAADEPFLCFQRHAVGDVLMRGHKVAGSAQRRWRAWQHLDGHLAGSSRVAGYQ
jgi:lipoate-protein ligase A